MPRAVRSALRSLQPAPRRDHSARIGLASRASERMSMFLTSVKLGMRVRDEMVQRSADQTRSLGVAWIAPRDLRRRSIRQAAHTIFLERSGNDTVPAYMTCARPSRRRSVPACADPELRFGSLLMRFGWIGDLQSTMAFRVLERCRAGTHGSGITTCAMPACDARTRPAAATLVCSPARLQKLPAVSSKTMRDMSVERPHRCSKSAPAGIWRSRWRYAGSGSRRLSPRTSTVWRGST